MATKAVSQSDIRLRTPNDSDIEFLRCLTTIDQTYGRWSRWGSTPSPKAMLTGLWEGVLLQYIVERPSDRNKLGFVSCAPFSLRDGWAHLLAVPANGELADIGIVSALMQLVDEAFSRWPLRLLIMETNKSIFGSIGTAENLFLDAAAVIPSYRFRDGTYEDAIWATIQRSRWQEFRGTNGQISVSLDALVVEYGMKDVLDLETFCQMIARFVSLVLPLAEANDPQVVQPEQNIHDDLNLDDFARALLGFVIQSLCDSPGIDLQIEERQSVGDLYLDYCTTRSAPTFSSTVQKSELSRVQR